jgi:hypothetical protein
MLTEEVTKLTDALNKLDKPQDISNKLKDKTKKKKKKATKKVKITDGQVDLDIESDDDKQIDTK